MSTPRYSGTIEFPASAFQDAEIRELLKEEGVEFIHKPFDPQLYLGESFGDLEVEIKEGIFYLNNSEARYGEFYDLEELLIKKGVPFDRESGMDWNAPPAIRIFRPPDFDYTDSTPDSYDEVVSVAKIRELIQDGEKASDDASLARRIEDYLGKSFPSYPPLADWVKQEARP
jgi:hypothetical protein